MGIGELQEGDPATVSGKVRAAGRTLVSRLHGRACVYWDVRRGLDDAPREHEACAFWVEDESGTRVLVRADALRVEVRGQRTQQLIETVESDIVVVSEQIRSVKDRARGAAGEAQRDLARERRRLAKVATLLCVIRAQARGNVHVGGTLSGQAKWIDANAKLASETAGGRTVKMMVDHWEVVLAESDTVEVVGVARRELLPAELGGGGYRDRSDCLAIGPDASGFVHVRGVGAAAPVSRGERATKTAPQRRSRASKDPRKTTPGPFADPIVVVTMALVGLAVLVTWLVTR